MFYFVLVRGLFIGIVSAVDVFVSGVRETLSLLLIDVDDQSLTQQHHSPYSDSMTVLSVCKLSSAVFIIVDFSKFLPRYCNENIVCPSLCNVSGFVIAYTERKSNFTDRDYDGPPTGNDPLPLHFFRYF